MRRLQLLLFAAPLLTVLACNDVTSPTSTALRPAFATVSATPTVSITDLGTLPGGRNSTAFSINDAGQVVGQGTTASGAIHAILWQNDVAIDLGTLPGGTSSFAYGINNLGQVVGVSTVAGVQHAVIWNNGTISDLGTPPGYTSIFVRAINDAGQMVGSASDGRFGHAVLWQGGVLTDLGGQCSQALAINNSGAVVGTYTTGISICGQTHAFIWQPGVGITDLGTLGGTKSVALGINDSGWVTGASTTSPTDPSTDSPGHPIPYHAFLWRPSTGMIDLGLLPGGARSLAESINNAGQVVGDAFTQGGTVNHAALFQAGTVVDLGTLSGGGAGVAYSINNKEQVVGQSSTGSGTNHATLWTIAQPQTITFTSTAPNQPLVGATYTVVATASSGLAVSISSLTPATCPVVGNTATFVAAGACTIAADQAGNAAYLAAPEQTQSITVITAAQAIQNLITTIESMGLPGGVANSLIAPLKNINTNNVAAACGKLNAFVSQVSAKIQNGQLNTSEANQLLQAANAIKTSMGCT